MVKLSLEGHGFESRRDHQNNFLEIILGSCSSVAERLVIFRLKINGCLQRKV